MINFASPWILLVLPLPLVLRYCLPIAKVKMRAALKVPFFEALNDLSDLNSKSLAANKFNLLMALLIWVLLVFAAAGPQLLGKPVTLNRAGRNIMLAVDLSGSMRIPDMSIAKRPATRLDVVKQVANEFIKKRQGDRIGLILFGSKAYLQTPLTFDRKTVSSMLSDATIGLAGPRTAIGDAIGLAIKRLKQEPKNSRVIVLLTDGASNAGVITPLQAAKIAAQEGIRIYTIGIGSDRLVVPGVFGPQIVNPSADLDSDTLQKIASITGGMFFRAKDTKALQQAYHSLDQLETTKGGESIFRPVHSLFQWPLSLALLLSVILVLRYLGLRNLQLPLLPRFQDNKEITSSERAHD